jgi:thiamine-monophosphate kinase
MSIENVHFRREYSAAADIGWKSATSSLSDIAAMGGTPLFCLVALACPPDTEYAYINRMYNGIINAVNQSGAVVVGGDTSSIPDRIVLDITVIGETIGNRYLTRRGAQIGDYLAVTGRPGMSSAGLHAMSHGHAAPELARAHHHPMARFTEGQWLCTSPDVHAMIDVSDGLARDAGHMADAANLGIDIDENQLPVSSHLRDYCDKYSLNPLEFILAGGEDYELAFAVSGKEAENCLRSFRRGFGTPVTIVGRFTDEWRGLRLNGKEITQKGYEHFKIGD